jgi:hypothetical protein
MKFIEYIFISSHLLLLLILVFVFVLLIIEINALVIFYCTKKIYVYEPPFCSSLI